MAAPRLAGAPAPLLSVGDVVSVAYLSSGTSCHLIGKAPKNRLKIRPHVCVLGKDISFRKTHDGSALHDRGNATFNCVAVRSSSAVNSMPTPASLAGRRVTLLRLLGVKECLLDFMAYADQPFFRMSGAVPKIVCLCLKFARSFLGCPQFGGKTVGKIHGSVAVCLSQICRLLHQGDNPASCVVRHHSSVRRRLFGSERNYRS